MRPHKRWSETLLSNDYIRTINDVYNKYKENCNKYIKVQSFKVMKVCYVKFWRLRLIGVLSCWVGGVILVSGPSGHGLLD